jgi:hypothetical protein
VSGDPIIVALGPLIQPALQAAFSLDERAWRRRALRGARTVQIAAEELGFTFEELTGKIRDQRGAAVEHSLPDPADLYTSYRLREDLQRLRRPSFGPEGCNPLRGALLAKSCCDLP